MLLHRLPNNDNDLKLNENNLSYTPKIFFKVKEDISSKIKIKDQYKSKEDKEIILVGHKGHQEVIGTSGQTKMKIIDDREKFELTKNSSKNKKDVVVLSQTTLSVRDTKNTIEKIKKIYPNALIRNDICYATTNRQEVTVKLANEVDLVLVVGASNSSNCNRLRDVAIDSGTNSYLINSFEEIKPEWLKNINKLGVTSGASTPDKLVYEIITKLKPKSVHKVEDKSENIVFEIPRKVKSLLDQ